MTDSTLIFKYLSDSKRGDGLIGRYRLGVTDTRSGKTVTISVEPKHLASAKNMKTILLDRCMVYSVTQKSHDQMLLKMFAHANGRAEITEYC